MVLKFTNQQTAILAALARYQCLTCPQLHLLKLGGLRSLRRSMRALVEISKPAALVKVHTFPTHARLGRLCNVYTLTEFGEHMISDRIGNPVSRKYKQPRIMTWFSADYFHRTLVIDFRIRVEMALKTTPFKTHRWHSYFQKTQITTNPKPGFTACTQVDFMDGSSFVPDTVFFLAEPRTNKTALITLECVCGNRVERTLAQIHRHRHAIQEKVVATKYSMPEGRSYLSLFLFEHPELLSRVIEHLNRDHYKRYRPYCRHFLFATVEDAERDILSCWRRLDDLQYLYSFIDGKRKYRLSSG